MVGCPGGCDARNAMLGYIRNIACGSGVLVASRFWLWGGRGEARGWGGREEGMSGERFT